MAISLTFCFTGETLKYLTARLPEASESRQRSGSLLHSGVTGHLQPVQEDRQVSQATLVVAIRLSGRMD